MDFRLSEEDRLIVDDLSVIEFALNTYDTLDDPSFEYDRDELLHERSRLELVRDQLSDKQRAELDKVDAHWRANAAAFNAAFATLHHQENKTTALEGFISDENGETPAIPLSHWWWAQIEDDE